MKIISLGVLILFLFGIFTGNTPADATASDPAGFLSGILHGATSVLNFIVSLFSTRAHMYAFANTGSAYDCGFLIGIALFLIPSRK